MNPTYYQTLPADVQAALSFIGISQDEQLHATTPAQVWQDLEKARRYFPEAAHALSREQVQAVFRHLPGYIEPPASADQGSDFLAPGEEHPSAQVPKNLPTPETDPTADDPLASQFMPARQGRKRHSNPLKSSHLIRNPRVLTTYLGAWATLLVPVMLIVIIAIAINTTTQGGVVDNTATGFLAGAFLSLLAYIYLHNKALCPICSMKVFTFRNYNRNRHAHHIPLLGYTLPTALRVALTGRFCCPACGSAMRLARRSSSRQRP